MGDVGFIQKIKFDMKKKGIVPKIDKRTLKLGDKDFTKSNFMAIMGNMSIPFAEIEQKYDQFKDIYGYKDLNPMIFYIVLGHGNYEVEDIKSFYEDYKKYSTTMSESNFYKFLEDIFCYMIRFTKKDLED